MSASTVFIVKVNFKDDLPVDDGIIAELVGMLLPTNIPDTVEKLTFIYNGREVVSRTFMEATGHPPAEGIRITDA